MTSSTPSTLDLGRLLVSCDDRPGIVAAISAFLHRHGANIVQSDQYSTNAEGGRFYQRVVFHLTGLSERRAGLTEEFARTVAAPIDADFHLYDAAVPKQIAIMVSRQDHCLMDLLWRWRRGELPVQIGLVISNHPDLAAAVAEFGVPFMHVPVDPQDKQAAEDRQLQLLGSRFELVVLARYMQVLSPRFLNEVGVPVINIHHSFLPAFTGAAPYAQAKQRGVKIIGATAHYVTEDLDEGPIIDQDVSRVSHRDDTRELVRLGADVERAVLARAVLAHCEDRVLMHGDTTVVF